jgi:hypothetical protein
LPRTFEQRVEPHTSQEYDGTTLRRFFRPKRLAIPNDNVVYLQVFDYNIGAENDLDFTSHELQRNRIIVQCHEGKDEFYIKSNRA